jgi:hypothetical protein
LRHAFLVFMTHNKHVADLGLRIPSLEERSSWKLLPSNRGVINNNNAGEPQENHGHFRDVQSRAAKLLKSQRNYAIEQLRDSAERRRFTPFDSSQLENAVKKASEYMQIANSESEQTGLEHVIEMAEEQAREEDLDLVKYAVMIFITHHRRAGAYLPIPSLEERSPEVFMLDRPLGISSSKDPESVLAWFREDPLANAHHEHWHIVYPHRGIPSRTMPARTQYHQIRQA